MTLSVGIRHWLTDDGDLPLDNPRLYRLALRIATLVEYGGPLQPLELRPTMVPCKRRPGRRPCRGLLLVLKLEDGRIQAHCPACSTTEAIISGWEDSDWADGQSPPLPYTDD